MLVENTPKSQFASLEKACRIGMDQHGIQAGEYQHRNKCKNPFFFLDFKNILHRFILIWLQS